MYLTSSLLLSDAVTLNMAELGAATVNRILHEKSCSEEEFLKELLNSRNNEAIVNHLKDSNRPREDQLLEIPEHTLPYQTVQDKKDYTGTYRATQDHT